MNDDIPNDDEAVMINLDARPKKGILKARPTAVAMLTEEMASHSRRREWSLCSRPVLWATRRRASETPTWRSVRRC
jgi:hypothetical protein